MVNYMPQPLYNLKEQDLRGQAVNLDSFTETFNLNFYFSYLTRWPECCAVAEAEGHIAGYIIGKVEGSGPTWHGHVSAISVAPEFRRTGVANRLMEYLEEVGRSGVIGVPLKPFHTYAWRKIPSERGVKQVNRPFIAPLR